MPYIIHAPIVYIMTKTFNIIYLGGPTIILEIAGLRIMTDPTLDPKGTSFRISDSVTETKLAGPAITDFGDIDLVLLSHDQHWDNLDKAGRQLLETVPVTITTLAGASRLAVQARGLAPWEQATVTGKNGEELVITATPARHGPAGTEHITGDVIGFLLSVNGQSGHPVYITGDTVFFEGVAQTGQRFHPQYVFVFAGAARPRGPFNVTMNSNDALDTAAAFPEAKIIPLHFEGWSHYTEGKDVLTAAFDAVNIGDRLFFPEPGRLITLDIHNHQ